VVPPDARQELRRGRPAAESDEHHALKLLIGDLVVPALRGEDLSWRRAHPFEFGGELAARGEGAPAASSPQAVAFLRETFQHAEGGVLLGWSKAGSLWWDPDERRTMTDQFSDASEN
jgi:hypothetical protein